MPTKAKAQPEPLAVTLTDAPPIVLPVRLAEGPRRLGRGMVIGADGKMLAESPELAWAERIVDALNVVSNTPPAALQATDPRETLVTRIRSALGELVELLKAGVPTKSDTGRRYQVERAVQKAAALIAQWEGRREEPWKPQPPLFGGVLPDPAMETPLNEPAPSVIPLPVPTTWPADLAEWELCGQRGKAGYCLRHATYGTTPLYEALHDAERAARRSMAGEDVVRATPPDHAVSVEMLPAPQGSVWGRVEQGTHVHLWQESGDSDHKSHRSSGSTDASPARHAWCGTVVSQERAIVADVRTPLERRCAACVSAWQRLQQPPEQLQRELQQVAPDLAPQWKVEINTQTGAISLNWEAEGYSTTYHPDLDAAIREARRIIAAQTDPAARAWATGDAVDEELNTDAWDIDEEEEESAGAATTDATAADDSYANEAPGANPPTQPAFWAALEGKRTAHFWRHKTEYVTGYWSNCGQDGRDATFQPASDLPRCKVCAKHGDANAPTSPPEIPPAALVTEVPTAQKVEAPAFPEPPQIGGPAHAQAHTTEASSSGAWATVSGDPLAYVLLPHNASWQALCNAHRAIVAPQPEGPMTPRCLTCQRAYAIMCDAGPDSLVTVTVHTPEPDQRTAGWGNKTAGTMQHWFVPQAHGWRSACTQVETSRPQLLHCPEQARCARCTAALARVPPPADPGIPPPIAFHWEQQDNCWRLSHTNGYQTERYQTPERAVAEAERWLASQPQPHTPSPADFPVETTYWQDGWRLIRDTDTRNWSVRHASGLATDPSSRRTTALERLPALEQARQRLIGWQVRFDVTTNLWMAEQHGLLRTADTVIELAARVLAPIPRR